MAAIRSNRTSPANRRSTQVRNGTEPNSGSSSWVVSSANRWFWSASHSASGGRRRGEPDQVGERRQMALAHHRRDGRGVDDLAEQLVDQHRLVGRQGGGRGRGQAQHGRVGQQLEELAEQSPPHLEQVMALVEHQRDRAGLLQGAHERLAVGMEPVELRGRPSAPPGRRPARRRRRPATGRSARSPASPGRGRCRPRRGLAPLGVGRTRASRAPTVPGSPCWGRARPPDDPRGGSSRGRPGSCRLPGAAPPRPVADPGSAHRRAPPVPPAGGAAAGAGRPGPAKSAVTGHRPPAAASARARRSATIRSGSSAE